MLQHLLFNHIIYAGEQTGPKYGAVNNKGLVSPLRIKRSYVQGGQYYE